MRNDLIFHVVSRRKWPKLNKNGYYRPEFSDETGDRDIICVDAKNLQDHLNQNFKGRKNLYILVVDRSRLISKVTVGGEGSIIVIKEEINLDAILDKIRIDCTKEGVFDISVQTD